MDTLAYGSQLSYVIAESVIANARGGERPFEMNNFTYTRSCAINGSLAPLDENFLTVFFCVGIFTDQNRGFHSLGVFQSLKKLLKHEGFQGFYKGNGASVIRIIPHAALHFMTYEEYRCWILNNYSALGTGPLIDLLAGSAAGGTAVLCTYPLDMARTKHAYQVENLQPSFQGSARYRNTWEGLTTIVHNQGWRQLFAGLSINYIKIVPSVAIGFTAYDMMKFWLRIPPRQKTQSISAA
uniref:Mitochondrial carrier protein n=1 Tax=Quercus lobata TaxID=97700 RepID=A0A7N2KR74_QUELO